MKNILVIFTFLWCLAITGSFAQTLTGAEYYFDSDPGVGKGIHISVTSGDELNKSFNFSVSGLTPGFHYLYIRAKDNLNRWSIIKGHLFYVYDDTFNDLSRVAPDPIGFEYFFDTDNGVGKGTWVSATPSDSISKGIDFSTIGLSAGFHKLLVRAKDAGGQWGQVRSHIFYVFDDTYIDLSHVTKGIERAEYFFDKDTVKQGHGVPLVVTPGNQVQWSGAIPVDGLSAGAHTLFIRVADSAGVWSIAGSKQFNVVNLVSKTNSPICAGSNDGEATITVDGGVPPFTYLWNDPLQQITQTATGLSAGIFTATVTDAAGAIIKEQVTITEFDTIHINITTSDTECNEANGSATASASGVNGPFMYLWSSGSSEESAADLRSGVYVITVTDNAGCVNTAVATINDIGGPEITVKAIQNLKCSGNANGIIDVNVTSGTPPYSYNWSNGETTQDILNLKAGNYELIVSDAGGCMAAKSIRVEQPRPLTFALSTDQADCGLNTGSATVTLSGGTVPYYYTWEGLIPPHNPTRENLGAGVYTLTVRDKNNCSSSLKVPISEKGAPNVDITSIIQSSCGNQNGQILVSVSGGTGSYSYNWKKEGISVSTLKNLTGVGPGEYNLAVSDGSGCKTYSAVTIPAQLPSQPQICLVTVDTLTGKNLVAWTKNPGAGIKSYNIYRETTSAGVFDLIATQPYDSLSAFTDDFADPVIRSWRYKISGIDNCGNESRLSAPHKTMHLTINLGILNSINLIWNHYEGFVPYNNTYNIWRWSNDSWTMIDNVPSNLNSYSDFSVPAGLVWYYIEAVHPTGCTPTLKAGTLNSSRSNRQSRLQTGIQEAMNASYNLNIYPNPGSGLFNLSMNLPVKDNVYIKVFDLSGKIVFANELPGQQDVLNFQVDLTELAKGIYHLQMKTDKGIFNKPLIIE